MSFLDLFGIIFLIGGIAGLIVSGVLWLGDLRNPLRQTQQQERRDARALRKENAMPFWGRLVQTELTWHRWKDHVTKVIQKDQTDGGRHRRAEGQLPTEVLAKAYYLKYGRHIRLNITEVEA